MKEASLGWPRDRPRTDPGRQRAGSRASALVARALWRVLNLLQTAIAFLWSALMITAALLVTLITRRRGPALAMARRLWAPGLLLDVGARLEVVGVDGRELPHPALVVANHQSWIDIPALFRAVPLPLLFVGKRELARVPFLGWYMSATGMVFVERELRSEATRSVGEAAARLNEGWCLLTFPEGSRSSDGRVQRFKSGSFAAAIEAGAPIVPVAIEGAGRVLSKEGLRVRPGTIRLTVGEPIPTAGLAAADRHDLARRTQREVEALLMAKPAG